MDPQTTNLALRAMLAKIILGFQLVVVFLGGLLLWSLGELEAISAIFLTLFIFMLNILAMKTIRTILGIISGTMSQIIMLAAGFIAPVFFITGALFGALWIYCFWASARTSHT